MESHISQNTCLFHLQVESIRSRIITVNGATSPVHREHASLVLGVDSVVVIVVLLVSFLLVVVLLVFVAFSFAVRGFFGVPLPGVVVDNELKGGLDGRLE